MSTRKTRFTVLSLILFSISSFTQAQTIGIKGGFTDAWQDYGAVQLPPDAETHIKGFHFSLEYYRQLNRFLSYGVEPGLVRRGAACVPGWNGGVVPIFNGDTKFLLDYVELPIALQGQIPLFKTGFSIFGKLGYGASFIAKAQQEKITFRMPQDDVTTTPITLGKGSILNRWDHGGYAGIGLSYQFSGHQIFCEYDFYNGFRDAERFNTSKNRDMDFSLGYRFTLNSL